MKTAALRAMLPKDVLERFLDGPSHHEELRNRVSAYVGRSWLDKMRTRGVQPMDMGRSTSPKEGKNMLMQFNSAACMIDPTRSTSNSPTTSENLSTVGATNLSPSASRQSTPRDKKPGRDEAKPGAGRKKRLISYRCMSLDTEW